jgi:hypothetical protein
MFNSLSNSLKTIQKKIVTTWNKISAFFNKKNKSLFKKEEKKQLLFLQRGPELDLYIHKKKHFALLRFSIGNKTEEERNYIICSVLTSFIFHELNSSYRKGVVRISISSEIFGEEWDEAITISTEKEKLNWENSKDLAISLGNFITEFLRRYKEVKKITDLQIQFFGKIPKKT